MTAAQALETDYPLIPISDITDEARLLAVKWVEEYGNMGFDIENKHKLASDIQNYGRRIAKYHCTEQVKAIEAAIIGNRDLDFDDLIQMNATDLRTVINEEYPLTQIK